MILLTAIFTESLNQKEIIIGVKPLFLCLLSPDSSRNTKKCARHFPTYANQEKQPTVTVRHY